MANQLRPMGVLDILRTAWSVYQRRFVPLLGISLVAHVPFAALTAVAAAALGSLSSGSNGEGLWNGTDPDIAMEVSFSASHALDIGRLPPFTVLAIAASALLAAFAFLSVVYPLCSAAILANVSELYLGRELGVGASYRRALPRLGTLLLSHTLGGLLIIPGFFFCGLPGVLFSLWFMLATPVVVLERLGASASLKRSRTLMKGDLGKGLRLAVALTIIGVVGSGAFAAAVGHVPWPAGFLAVFFLCLSPAWVLPLTMTATALLYFDLRVRKEGFDLEYLGAGLNAAP